MVKYDLGGGGEEKKKKVYGKSTLNDQTRDYEVSCRKFLAKQYSWRDCCPERA